MTNLVEKSDVRGRATLRPRTSKKPSDAGKITSVRRIRRRTAGLVFITSQTFQ